MLTLLVHLGYLTCGRATGEVFIPNQEIAQEYENAIEGPAWDGAIRQIREKQYASWIEKLSIPKM